MTLGFMKFGRYNSDFWMNMQIFGYGVIFFKRDFIFLINC